MGREVIKIDYNELSTVLLFVADFLFFFCSDVSRVPDKVVPMTKPLVMLLGLSMKL